MEKLKASLHVDEIVKWRIALANTRNLIQKANSINEELLPDFVMVVPAGITRIIIRQAEGYSYVKP